MDTALNRKSLMLGAPGIAMQIGGRLMVISEKDNRNPRTKSDSTTDAIGTLLMLTGTVLLILGLSMYARAKGHSPWWCLMGVLSIIGLIVLAALPDRLKSK